LLTLRANSQGFPTAGRRRLTRAGRLGQHFLVDPALRDRVVDSAGIEPEDEVRRSARPGT